MPSYKYTLIIIQLDKSIVPYQFENKWAMMDFKNYSHSAIKDCELQQVDRDGYVWACELAVNE